MEAGPHQQTGGEDFVPGEEREHRTWRLPFCPRLLHPSYLRDWVPNVITPIYTCFWQKKIYILCLSSLNLVFANIYHSYKKDLENPQSLSSRVPETGKMASIT